VRFNEADLVGVPTRDIHDGCGEGHLKQPERRSHSFVDGFVENPVDEYPTPSPKQQAKKEEGEPTFHFNPLFV